jgi:hypothetical protein
VTNGSVLDLFLSTTQGVADATPGFFEIKGPGEGDRATNAFMKVLREQLKEAVPDAKPEQCLCGENKLAVDFYIEAEGTIVELAFGLRNPTSEFERDILKALMAKEAGRNVKQLVFVSKPGAVKRCGQPGAQAIVKWAKQKHDLAIAVYEVKQRAT